MRMMPMQINSTRIFSIWVSNLSQFLPRWNTSKNVVSRGNRFKCLQWSFGSALLLFLVAIGRAEAGEFWSEDPVTNTSIVAANVLLLADWAQTRYGTDRPDQFEETGLALHFTGAHPTTGDVNRYNLGVLILMNVGGYYLPEKASFFGLEWNPKKCLYMGVTAVEAHTVNHNVEAGVKLQF